VRALRTCRKGETENWGDSRRHYPRLAVKNPIPSATVSRLPVYLRCLSDLPTTQMTCSSDQLGTIAGVNSAQVRKDLSYIDAHGVRGVGYDINELRRELRRALGLMKSHAVAIIGAGNLGTALSNYPGFAGWGFEVKAMFDVDPSRVGEEVDGLLVEPLSDLERIVSERSISIGIVATPSHAAQDVADRLVRAGVRSILNFAPAILRRMSGVEVRRVDLSTELQILAYYLQQD